MSYNITTWKTKKMDNLVIPIDALYMTDREDWIPEKPEIFNFKTNEVDIECGCEQKILGILNDGMLNVTSLNLTGEGSGALMDYVIEPALKLSKGYLEATLIWEGGDSVTKLIVSDGVLTNEPIEL